MIDDFDDFDDLDDLEYGEKKIYPRETLEELYEEKLIIFECYLEKFKANYSYGKDFHIPCHPVLLQLVECEINNLNFPNITDMSEKDLSEVINRVDKLNKLFAHCIREHRIRVILASFSKNKMLYALPKEVREYSLREFPELLFELLELDGITPILERELLVQSSYKGREIFPREEELHVRFASHI
tara:strand:- start:273 stop:830 length:558 start_codon:yes stop_codon:yes gene_type:complete